MPQRKKERKKESLCKFKAHNLDFIPEFISHNVTSYLETAALFLVVAVSCHNLNLAVESYYFYKVYLTITNPTIVNLAIVNVFLLFLNRAI